MIDIEEVTFQNFLSYGNYSTTIPLGKLGPCLIIGPNGAGKSTVVNAILYPLFGRTMHVARPGDRVVNENTDADCMTSLKLKNGDTITRTRKMQNHNELVVERGGEQLLATLSTTPNQQAQLNRLYNLDWHNFCNTSFLTQIGRTWFEMPEPQRKKEIERSLKLDRYTLRAQVAKEKLDKTTNEQSTVRLKYDSLGKQIEAATEDRNDTQELQATFDVDRKARVDQAIAQAREYKERYDSTAVPDVAKLQKRWDALVAAQEALSGLEKKLETTMAGGRSVVVAIERELKTINESIMLAEHDIREADRTIKLWADKDGKVCTACEQSIPHAHTEDKITPYIEKRDHAKTILELKRTEVVAIRERIKAAEEANKQAIIKAQTKIATLKDAIKAQTPDMNIREANTLIKQREAIRTTALQWAQSAKAISTETNPHAATIAKHEKRIAAWTGERDTLKVDVDRFDVTHRHLSYIYKAYNDRRKIKSHSVSKFLPLLNSRLRHYLERFRIDMGIEITDSLGVVTKGRSYDFMSGGERKRVDVSFMLARFDMQETLFGRQSNVLVLDEVDGRMDDEGVECLKSVVLDDLAPRVDTILVISHKESMRDAFPHQITIEKRGDFSLLAEVR